MQATSSCPLCQSREAEVLASQDRHGQPLTTVLCRGCGLGRVDPLPAPQELAAFYQERYRLEYKGTFEPKPHHVLRAGRIAQNRIRLLEPWLRPGMSLLDLGSGGGELVYLLSQRGVRARGHEEDPRYAGYARRELGIPVTEGDWQAVAATGATPFDAVTLFHVLEHLHNPVAALAQVREWLAPGGFALVEVPNLEFAATRGAHRFHAAHLYYFNGTTLRAAGEQAGLEARELFTSPDGGNLLAHFTRGPGPRPAAPSPSWTGNFEHRLRLENRRGEFRYWLSPVTWQRTLARVTRLTEERARARRFPCRVEILQSLR